MPQIPAIRLATQTDAAAIRDIYAPIVQNTHISFEQVVPTADEIAARVQNTLAQYPWLVCELDARLAGYAYASAFRSRPAYQWTIETTVYVHGDFQRRGIARALYTSLLALLRAQGFVTAVGVIALPNPASIRAHEAVGFYKIGVFRNVGHKAGEWRDTGWWQLDMRPAPAAPEPPLPLSALAQEARFSSLLAAGLPHIRR
ncbi:MAG: GNAT family N-acetyltransferase [Chloroflexi bacterium]|nr:GNAT family N-acetyltransferase [Chloroflexota bacterium]